MYPIVIANLATRVAAVARTAAPTFGAAVARLRPFGYKLSGKAEDVIKWAKENPINASMVAMALASLGVEVADLFETPAGKATAGDLQTGRTSLASEQKILAAGAKSETLQLDIAQHAGDVRTAIEVLRWAKGQYGSEAAAVNAHRLQQAFFEMPIADVRAGYETLRV